jgi:hypothetical protein
VDLLTAGGAAAAQWHHVAATISGNTATSLYIDGNLVASGSINSGSIGTTAYFWIGTLENGANNFIRPFEGQIDDLRIYNEALSANAIANLARGIPEPAAMIVALIGLCSAAAFSRRRM